MGTPGIPEARGESDSTVKLNFQCWGGVYGWALLFGALSGPSPVFGQPVPPAAAAEQSRKLVIPRVSRSPKLENFLSGAPREPEARVTGFRQRVPGDGAPSTQETTAYLSYDAKNLYVVFVCKEESGKVRAHLAKREEISDDDQVAVYLDTFHDRQRSYVFASNPLGVQQDGVRTEGQKTDYSWDTLWHSEGRLTGNGFVVWMAIPFKSLRFSNAPVQSWGIALNRSILRNNEDTYWPYITDKVAGFTQQMATMEGLEHVSPGRNVQLIPYGTFAQARTLDTGIPKFVTQDDKRVGLDSKIVLHDAFTLDATLNPDFSQVESDDPQVTINQRYEVYFPEKRPFFLENSGYFQTPLNLFFSRRIVDPQFGARLTGKVGRWSIGALGTDDRAPGQLISDFEPLHGERAGIGVVSVRREFGSQSSAGLLATSRDFGSSYNRVVSLDTRLMLNSNWYFDGQAVRSYDRELDGSRFDGSAYYADLGRSGRNFNYVASYTDLSPDFRTELGYIKRVDIRTAQQWGNYRWHPESKRVLSFGLTVSALMNWDHTGRLEDWQVGTGFAIEFPRQTQLNLWNYETYEYYWGQGFRKRSSSVSLYTAPKKWLGVYGFYGKGSDINYSPGYGLTPFLANSRNASFTMTLRPTPRLRFDETYIYNSLGTRNGSLPPIQTTPAAIFSNHLARSKINYQFTRALSARVILDYYAILPNPSLIKYQRYKAATGDVLITYLLNPGTALYFGYTNSYENVALVGTNPPTVISTIAPQTSTARQFFVKLSYLFRF